MIALRTIGASALSQTGIALDPIGAERFIPVCDNWDKVQAELYPSLSMSAITNWDKALAPIGQSASQLWDKVLAPIVLIALSQTGIKHFAPIVLSAITKWDKALAPIVLSAITN